MRALFLALLASTALAGPVLAQEVVNAANVPVASSEDPNMRVIAYRPGARVRIIGNPGRLTTITFGTNEQIARFVFGDAVGGSEDGNIWDTERNETADGKAESGVQPLGNNFHMWAVRPGYTNLVIVTKVDGGASPDRLYHFAALVQNLPSDCLDHPDRACDDPKATYGLRFTYPEQERQQRVAEAAARQHAVVEERTVRAERAARRVAKARLAVDFYNGADRNWCWQGQGDAILEPNKNSVSDNRQETTLDYGGRPIPAFSLVNPDGSDGEVVLPVMRDGLVVLPVAPGRIRIRLGTKLVLDLINCGHDQTLRNPGTYTTRPDVYRTVRGQP